VIKRTELFGSGRQYDTHTNTTVRTVCYQLHVYDKTSAYTDTVTNQDSMNNNNTL